MTQKRVMFHRDDGADPTLPPLTVEVWEEAELNERASAGGVPMFDTVVRMEVTPTGQKSGVIYTPRRVLPDGTVKLDQQVIKRFRRLWEEYEAGAAPAASGTPLEEWPLMTVSIVAALKLSKVYTVQQLAEVPDTVLHNLNIPKPREWRSKAAGWLESAAAAGDTAFLRGELAKRDQQIEQMQGQINELLMRQNGVPEEAFDKPKRGKRRARANGDDDMVVVESELEQAVEDEGPRI